MNGDQLAYRIEKRGAYLCAIVLYENFETIFCATALRPYMIAITGSFEPFKLEEVLILHIRP